MNRKELHATAHRVINSLVDSEPGAERAIDPTAWRKTVRNRLRSEHWITVLAALEAGDQPDALAERIRASIPPPANPYAGQHEPLNPSTLLKPWAGPTCEPEDGPVIDDPDEAKARLAAIRSELGPAHHPSRAASISTDTETYLRLMDLFRGRSPAEIERLIDQLEQWLDAPEEDR